jgi:hypothetical protein
LLEAGDHIHIPRKDMNLAVIKPPTGLATSLTLLKTGKKNKQKKESQENYKSRSNERTHTPVIVHVAALPHGFFTPEFNTTAQEGAGGREKNTRREQGQALRLLKPFTERERERETDRRSAPLSKKKKQKGKLCCVSLCGVCCCGVVVVFVAAARRC